MAALAATMLLVGSVNAESHVVVIKGSSFSPEKIEIQAGDSVTWKNEDIVPHTATATNKSWDSGHISPGEEKTVEFTTPFFGDYFCLYHPSMKAQLVMKKEQ